jgi:hypothetical protein
MNKVLFEAPNDLLHEDRKYVLDFEESRREIHDFVRQKSNRKSGPFNPFTYLVPDQQS